MVAKAVIAGGSGFIGGALAKELLERDYEVIVLTRRADTQLPSGARAVVWSPDGGYEKNRGDETANGPLAEALAGARVLINLAGTPIAQGRWTAARKQAILNSRILPTRTLVSTCSRLAERPQVLVSSSAVGYYGPRGDEIVSEQDGPGQDFLSGVCRAWEDEARQAAALGIRTVLLRTGIALGRGGALSKMLLPFRLFAGGPMGSGRQWWPWIHLSDLTGLIIFLIETAAARGPVNGTAPQPVTNNDFARTLGQVMGRPAGLRVPAPLLRLILGEMAEATLLHGQRAVPKAAKDLGFEFRYPDLTSALTDLL